MPKPVLRAMLASNEGFVERIDDFYVAGSIKRCWQYVWQLWGSANQLMLRKIGITRASALRVISNSLAHTLLSFYLDNDMRKLEMANVE